MTERVGRAVLELATDQAQLQKDFQKLKADLADVKTHVAGVDGAMQKLGSAIKTAMKAFVVVELLQAVKSFIDLTGNLTDLAAKTGLTTTELQKLKYAADQNGSSLEQMTQGVTQMSKRLVEGDKSTVAALRSMGLEIDKVRNMRPGDAFALIGDKIAGIQNPMERATVAMEIFGKSGAELLPVFTGNLQAMGEEAEKSGLILSEEVVAAGDEFGDTLGKLFTLGMALLGQVLGPFLPLLQLLAEGLVQVAQVIGAVLKPAFEIIIAVGQKVMDFIVGMVQGFIEFAMKIPGASTVIGALKSGFDALKQGAINLHASLVPVTTETKNVATAAATVPPVLRATKASAEDASKTTKVLADSQKYAAEWFEKSAKAAHSFRLATLESANAIREHLTWGERERALLDAATTDWLELAEAMRKASTLEGVFAFGQLGIAANARIGQEIPIPEPPPAPPSFWEKIWSSVSASAGTLKDMMASTLQQAFGALSSGGIKGLAQFGTTVAKDFTATMLSFIPGIGPLLSQFAGPLVDGIKKLFGGLFGPTEYEKRVRAEAADTRRLQEEAVAMAGSMAKLREMAHAVGIQIDEAFKWRDPAALKKVIDEVFEKNKQAAQGAQEAAAATVKAHAQLVEGLKSHMSELDQEYKGLAQTIANEAPEEHMGVIEAQARARMDVIEQEKKALQKQIDEAVAGGDQLTDAVIDRARTADEEIREIFGRPMRIPVEFVPTNAPGGASAGAASSLRAMDASSRSMTFIVERDGRREAEWLVPFIPGAVRRWGFT